MLRSRMLLVLVLLFCLPLFSENFVDRFPILGVDAIETEVSIEHVFVPKGIDNNDDGAVIAFGLLPSPCFQSPVGRAFRAQNSIRVSAQAIETSNRICLPMQVPFLIPIRLGVLEEGTFVVEYVSDHHNLKKKTLSIERAKTGAVDNHVYAHVTRIEVDKEESKLILVGKNPSDCYEFDRMETIYNGVDTYAILPILKQVKNDCSYKPAPFRYELDLLDLENKERILWHVRRMDGKSINLMWSNEQGFIE